MVRILGGYKEESVVVGNESGNPNVLITRDLLGGGGSSSKLDSQELDLDLKVPDGWEKRLDLKVSLFGLFLPRWFVSGGNFRLSCLGQKQNVCLVVDGTKRKGGGGV